MDRATFVRCAFEQAQAGGTDGDYSATSGAQSVKAVGGGGVYPAPFGVHLVVGSVVNLHRQESACPDVEGECLAGYSGPFERVQQFRGEVECSGGRGNGAVLAGEHRLVVLGILLVGGAFAGDVGRQWHPACAFEQQIHRLVAGKGERPAAIGVTRFCHGGNACREGNDIAFVQTPGVADKGLPAAQIDAFVQGSADPGVAARAFKLGGNHAGIVEHQHITLAQE